MSNFRNYNDVLRVAKEYIKKDNITDNDIISLAGVLCNFILNDEHPQTAAGNVINTFVDSLNTEEIRISCGHDTTQSSKMAERYTLLINTIAPKLKFSFPVSVKTKEFIEAHNIYEPQHEVPEAPQQPIEGNDGELAGNGNVARPDESPEADEVQYIKLPLGMQTTDQRAERIFKSAINNGWMEADKNHGTWYGFDKTKDGRIKNRMQSLAYLCGKTYNLTDTNQTQNWGIVEKYFRVQELSKHWGNVIGYERRSGRKQSYQTQIDTLISEALRTP